MTHSSPAKVNVRLLLDLDTDKVLDEDEVERFITIEWK